MVSRRKRRNPGGGRLPRAVQHADFLSILGKARTRKLRETLLSLASKHQIDAVLECLDNINKRNIPIPTGKVRQLKSHSGAVKSLLNPRVSLQKKKQILGQSGGFLSAILPVAISALGSLFGGLVGRK